MTSHLEAKKSLGQNFLVDQNIINKIIMAIAPAQEESLIEIGPGQGALTQHLLKAGASVTAVEKDPRMPEVLTNLAKEMNGDLTIHLGDALEVNYQEDIPLPYPVKLVGNLPYNVGTQIVIHAIHHPELFSTLTFMLQKEVIDRIIAKPGSSNWGRLGVWCDLLTERAKLFDVPPSAFRPRPKVVSSIVQIKPLKKPRFDVNIKNLEIILRQAFGQRRKMLRASLKGFITTEQMKILGISPEQRPETLTTEEFCKLANSL